MPRHGHKAPRRESRALACAAVAAPWLMLGLVCSLQPAQALWLLRVVLLAAVATLQPLSPPISDKPLGNKPKRKVNIGADRPPISPAAPVQSDVVSSSRPHIRSRVSTSKALSSNKWTPKPLSPLSGNYCSNSGTTSTTNSSTVGKGNSSNNMQSSPAATSNHSSSGTSSATAAAARSCFGAGNSGGWDDSDEGGNGGDRPRFQAVKSHSLDAPDSAAVAVASSSATTPANSRTNSSSHGSSSNTPGGSVPSLCDTVPSGDMPLSPTTAAAAAESELRSSIPPQPLLPAPAVVPSSHQATTGPWKLNSPFAAATTPFDSGGSANRSSAAAPAAVEPQQGPTAATGPWRLSSPFAAAPLPAFSSNLDAADGTAAAAADATPAAKSSKKKALVAADTDSKQHQRDVTWQPQQQQQAKQCLEPPHMCPPRPKVYKQQQQQSVSPKGTTGPWALHSPFIAAATPPTLEVEQEIVVSSSQPAAAAVGAVADPFGSPLPAQFGSRDLAATAASAGPSSSSTTAAGSRGNTPTKRERRKSRVGMPTTPPSPHTGPWALFSPFAAAVAAEAAPDRNAQQQQTVEPGSNSNADQFVAAAAIVKTDRAGSGGSVRSDRSGSGAGQASSTPTAAAAGSRGNTPAKRERRKSRVGLPNTPPSPHTGPWVLFSPFAAAVAAEAAPDRSAQQQQTVDNYSNSNADQSAAATIVKTDRAGSSGSVRSDRSGSGDVRSNLGQLPAGTNSPSLPAAPGQLSSSSRDISVRLSDATAATPSSVHSVSEPRHSLAFSFPSVGISAGASNADTAVTSAATSGGFDHGLDLDLQPTPMASMFWGGEGLSPVPSESELVMSELDDAKAVAAAGDQSEIKQQQQQRMRHVRGGRLHDSAHSHLMQHKVPIVAVQQQPVLINPVPAAVAVPAAAPALAPKATTGPWALHSPFAASAAPASAAPAAAETADTAVTAAGVAQAAHIAAQATAAGHAVFLDPTPAAAGVKDPMLLAPPPAALPARIKTPVLLDPLAPATQAAPSSPSAPAAADAAATAAAAWPKNTSCLCCYPPALTEGQTTDVHVYIAGLDLPAPAADAVLRAVVVRGSVIVADYTGICRPSDGLFRVPIPGLPNGPLQLGIFLGKQLCFTQTLLVLPGPSAQEMILLWGSLLQSHLALQQEQQQQQQTLTRQQGSQQGSLAIRSESIGSGWNSQGSASSDSSGGGGAAAGDGQHYHTVQEGFAIDGGGGGGSSWMPAGVEQQQQQEGGIVGSVGGISSVDVQTVWQRQYTPVLTDIAYLLSAQIQKSPSTAVSPSATAAASPFAADGSSPRSMAAAAAGQSCINMETPKFKSMVTHLVQFLAANGLWAVLQLITDSVYGVGASAKALYTAKAATSAAASGAASVKGGGGSSGASSTSVAATVKITQATQTATTASTEIEVAGPAAGPSSSEPPAAIADPAAAVAAVVAAVEAGQSLDLSAVQLLLLLAIRTSSKRGLAYCRAEGFVPVLQQSIRAVGTWGRQLGLWVVDGVALLVLGLLWVYDSVSLLVAQYGKDQAGSTTSAVAPEPVAAAAVEPVVDLGL